MNAVLSSNSSNQVPTNQHSFLPPVWVIFFSPSSSTISSSSSLQMTWEHSFPSSFIPHKCEHPFLIWCANHFQLLAGWWKSFKIHEENKTFLLFSKNPLSFQEPSSSSSYPICDYGEHSSSSLASFFLIMVKHFCLSSSSLLHNGVQLSSSSSFFFLTWRRLFFFIVIFFGHAPFIIIIFFLCLKMVDTQGWFVQVVSIDLHMKFVGNAPMTFFKYSLMQNKGQKEKCDE